MPNSSRNSMKNNIFNVLPDQQVFEGVSYKKLSDIYERVIYVRVLNQHRNFYDQHVRKYDPAVAGGSEATIQ